MSQPSENPAEPVMAQMIHQTHLATWLVRTAGKAIATLVLVPAAGWLVAAATDEVAFAGLGSLVGALAFLAILTNAQAPLPTPEVIDLLGPEDDAGESGS